MTTVRHATSTPVRKPPSPPSAPSLITNWPLVAIPTVFASHTIHIALGVALMVALTVAALRSSGHQLTLTWPCAVLPLVSLSIALRWYDDRTMIKAVFVIWAATITAFAVKRSASKTSAFVSLIDGAGLFSVASVVLWQAGFQSGSSRPGGFANTTTGGERIIFPLSTAMNTTPEVAGVFLACVIPIVVAHREHRLLRFTAAGCAIAVLIQADSRTGMIVATAVGACAVIIPAAIRRLGPPLVGLALLAPLIYNWTSSLIAWGLETLNSVVPWLVRPNLNRRDYIWERAVSYYQNQIDWVHQMLGYGVAGHARSGAVEYYWSDEFVAGTRESVSPHHSMLQILFDGGWLAGAIVLLTLVWAAHYLARQPSTVVGLSALLALVLTGVTGVSLTPGDASETWWLLVALLMITGAREAPTNPTR